MTVRNIKKSLAGVEDIATGIGTLKQERGVVHRVNVFPSSYGYIDMQQYEGGDFFRLFGSDLSYTDYRRNPAGTIGIPAGAGGVWEPLTSNDKIVGGNTVDGAYLVDNTYLVWHAASSSNYAWSGYFPHTVAPGTDPTLPGSGYELRTDETLRSDVGLVVKSFSTVASMIASCTSGIGVKVQCLSFHEGFLLPSPNIYEITTDTPDGCFVIALGSGLSATLIYNKQITVERIGAKPDLYLGETETVNPSKTDNWPVFNSIKTKRVSVLAFGGYFLSQKLDLGNGGVEKYGSIKGLINRNFDGRQSVLAFNGSGGVEVFAGADIQDITLVNLGSTKVGVGLKADNVHGAKISNVTPINFALGAHLFLWASQCERVIAYQCTDGIRITNESTSTTYSSCYAKECVTGFDLGGSFTYSTLQNCAVDDCDIPYLFRGGSNIDLNNCGAEIRHANIAGFFRFETTEAAATVSISGGRYIMLGGKTCGSIAYAPPGTPNAYGVILFSRINTNTFSSPVAGFIYGSVRALLSDSCVFQEPFNLKVADGSVGAIVSGFSNGSGSQYAIRAPAISGVNTTGQGVRHKIVIERYIDFAQAKTDGKSVYLIIRGIAADSLQQLKVESIPAGLGGLTYQEWRAWTVGNNQAGAVNIIGTQFNMALTNSEGYRCLIFNRDAQLGRALVRVTAEGLADSGYRDVLTQLVVGTFTPMP